MLLREKFEAMLIENGMSNNQAKEVMVKAMVNLNTMFTDYNISWNRSADEYPSVVHNVIFNGIKKIALDWIEENKPMAWFKPMFENK